MIAVKREVATKVVGVPWSECQVRKLTTSHCTHIRSAIGRNNVWESLGHTRRSVQSPLVVSFLTWHSLHGTPTNLGSNLTLHSYHATANSLYTIIFIFARTFLFFYQILFCNFLIKPQLCYFTMVLFIISSKSNSKKLMYNFRSVV